MGLFGSKKKMINDLKQENDRLKKRVTQLENRSDEKDDFFKELMSDALRHGSHLAAKHMSDRKKYLRGK